MKRNKALDRSMHKHRLFLLQKETDKVRERSVMLKGKKKYVKWRFADIQYDFKCTRKTNIGYIKNIFLPKK